MQITNTTNTGLGDDADRTNLPVRVPLSELIRDGRSQIRRSVDRRTARRYADAMRAGAALPPITVAMVNGAPFLIDGWHRVAAAETIGQADIPAHVIDAPPEHHAWIAARENMRNGLPLRRNEARAVFKAYVRAGQHRKGRRGVKSSREIADELNGIRSHATILKWMGQDFPRIRGMMRQDAPDYGSGAAAAEKPTDHESHMIEETLGHLEEARKLCRGVTDPVRRGELITQAEAIIAAMKAQGDWVPPAPDELDF